MPRAMPLLVVVLLASCSGNATPTSEAPDGARPAEDAGAEASRDAGGMLDADDGCPADIAAAAGGPCSHEGQSCGGSSCTNPCTFCHIIRCASGVWADWEVLPAPCDGGGAEGGPEGGFDAGSEAGADAGGSTCGSPSDCRTFSDYCGGCSCEALGVGETAPACDGGLVGCFVDPCQGHTATCDSNHRCAIQ